MKKSPRITGGLMLLAAATAFAQPVKPTKRVTKSRVCGSRLGTGTTALTKGVARVKIAVE